MTTRLRLRRITSALLAATALAAPSAFAWSHLGHWLVGDLAATQLTPAARKDIAELLQGEPDPTLAGVASWPDEMRGTDPDRFKTTSRWHYVDLDPDNCDYVPPRDCAGDNCVIAQIDAQRKILADTTQPLEARRDALKFLVHFIGDVHQPFHAGSRIGPDGHDDAGGNKYQISLRTSITPEAYARKSYVNGVMGTNLHAVWDYYELESAVLAPEKYADKLQRDGIPALTPATLGTPLQWAQESCHDVNVHQLYPLTADGKEQHKLGGAYLDAQRPLAEERVRLAAARLAEVLNETLK